MICGIPLGSMVGPLSFKQNIKQWSQKVKSGLMLENELSVLVLCPLEQWDLIISEDYFLSNLICLINFGFTVTVLYVVLPPPPQWTGTEQQYMLIYHCGPCALPARYRLGDRTVQSHFTHGGIFDEEQLKREMRVRTFKDLPFRLSAVNMFTPTSL